MTLRAARLTGPSAAAIALVTLRGAGAADLVRRLTGAEPPAIDRHALRALRGPGLEALDQAVVVARGPEAFEFGLHGGPAVVRGFLAVLAAAGVEVVDAADLARGALERRARERARELLCPAAVHLLLHQARGALRDALAELGREERAFEARLALLADLVQDSIAHAPFLRRLTVAIVGPPNAGKSTLLNALLGCERAQVADAAGTTRDPVAHTMALGSFTLHLLDTAGLGDPRDALDREAQRRTVASVERADVVLWASERGLREPPATWVGKPVIEVATLCDRGPLHRSADVAVEARRDPQAARLALRTAFEVRWPVPAAFGRPRPLLFERTWLERAQALLARADRSVFLPGLQALVSLQYEAHHEDKERPFPHERRTF